MSLLATIFALKDGVNRQTASMHYSVTYVNIYATSIITKSSVCMYCLLLLLLTLVSAVVLLTCLERHSLKLGYRNGEGGWKGDRNRDGTDK
jgi:hypothetical protein